MSPPSAGVVAHSPCLGRGQHRQLGFQSLATASPPFLFKYTSCYSAVVYRQSLVFIPSCSFTRVASTTVQLFQAPDLTQGPRRSHCKPLRRSYTLFVGSTPAFTISGRSAIFSTRPGALLCIQTFRSHQVRETNTAILGLKYKSCVSLLFYRRKC